MTCGEPFLICYKRVAADCRSANAVQDIQPNGAQNAFSTSVVGLVIQDRQDLGDSP
jgi:hypothetical protein